MKLLLCTLAAVGAVLTTALADDGPPKIGTGKAWDNLGRTVVVTGRVAQVSFRPTITFLNLDKPYPQTEFTAVIFARNTNQFGDLSALKDKAVEITGKVDSHNDKPQIVLEKKEQLKVVEAPAATDKPATPVQAPTAAKP